MHAEPPDPVGPHESSAPDLDGADAQTLVALVAAQSDLLRCPPDPDVILRVALARVVALTGAEGAALEVLDGPLMRYRGAIGALAPHVGRTLNVHRSISGLCARTREAICCADIELDDRADREACRAMGVRSMAVVPVLEDGAVLGALKVVSSRVGAFDEGALLRLRLLGGVAAAALGRAEEQRRRERAEAALRRSEASFRTLVEALPDGVLLFRHGTILYANPPMLAYLGYADADELLGRSALDLVPPEEREAAQRAIDGLATPGESAEVTRQRLVRRDGSMFEAEVRAIAITFDERSTVLAVCRDLGERRRLQAELRRTLETLRSQRDELLRLQRQKEDLTRLLVHDLKNPIAVVQLEASFLAESPELSPAHVEAARAIAEAADTTSRMVTDLLDISRSEDGELTLDKAVTDVHALVVAAHGAAVHRAAVRGQSLVLDAEGALSRTASLDAGLVRRVVDNLIDNAMKYGGAGGTITVSAAIVDGAVHLGVTDDGPGIPDDCKGRVFDKYAQLDRDVRARGIASRGLGLTFCKLAVEAHGGTIHVEDAPPRGSRFHVRIPA